MKPNSFVQLAIIQAALITGLVMITIMMIVLNQTQPITIREDSELTFIFLLSSMFVTIAVILGGKVIFTKLASNARRETSLELKMKKYVSAVIIRFALMEAAAIFSAVSIYLTGSLYFLVLIAIVFFFFIVERPSKEKIAMDLNLSPEERLMI